jgi:hypothetical protein
MPGRAGFAVHGQHFRLIVCNCADGGQCEHGWFSACVHKYDYEHSTQLLVIRASATRRTAANPVSSVLRAGLQAKRSSGKSVSGQTHIGCQAPVELGNVWPRRPSYTLFTSIWSGLHQFILVGRPIAGYH